MLGSFVLACCGLVSRIQIATLESCELPQSVQIVDSDAALAQGQQVVLAKLTQHAIDVYGRQPKRVSENELTERTFERGLGRQACHAQPFRQFHEEVRGSLDGVAASDADKVLDDHGFVA